MDADRFDRLTTSLVGTGTRRRLLVLLTALPLGGGLTALEAEESAAKRKGHHRRKHNHRHSGRRKENRKGKRKGKRKDDALGAGVTCRSLDQICSVFSGPACCSGTTCQPTIVPFVTTCQSGCETNLECFNRFPGMDVECVIGDAAACPLHLGCCRPKACKPERSVGPNVRYGTTYFNSRDTKTCKHVNGVCCGLNGAAGVHNCCLPGQVCVGGDGCYDVDLLEFAGADSATCRACTSSRPQQCCGGGNNTTCCSADNFCYGKGCRSFD